MLPFDFARCRPYKPDNFCLNCKRYSDHPDQTYGPRTPVMGCYDSTDTSCLYIAIMSKEDKGD